MTTGIKKGTLPQPNQYIPNFPQVELNPLKFNALIDQYGIRLLHEKVSLCPNYMGVIGSQVHATGCTLCENSYVHYDPREMVGYFSTNTMVRNFFLGGYWENGTALLTVPSHHVGNIDDQIYVSHNDKFTLLDFEDRIYEVIHKNDGDLDKLRYKAIYVEFLRTAKKIYSFKQHFDINENGDVIWLTNDRPGKDLTTGLGELFTISYLYRPIYRVVQMLHEGRYSQVFFKQPKRLPTRFPQQMIIKKDFLIDKKDAQGNPIEEPKLP